MVLTLIYGLALGVVPLLCILSKTLPQLTPKNLCLNFFIFGNWNFPEHILHLVPYLTTLVMQITLPCDLRDDSLVWSQYFNGGLSLKEAYALKSTDLPIKSCGKNLWKWTSLNIKAFIIWRLYHDKATNL